MAIEGCENASSAGPPGLEKEVTIEAYVPIAQVPDPTTIWLANSMSWLIHTDDPPLALTNAVRRQCAAVDPDVPASFVRSIDQWVAGTLAPRRFNLQLVVAFAATAMLLAMVGVYAVSASAVAARQHEIGIRAAFVASRFQVMPLVLGSGLAPVVAGLGTGAAITVLSGAALDGSRRAACHGHRSASAISSAGRFDPPVATTTNCRPFHT